MELVCTLVFTAALDRCGMSVEDVERLYKETNYEANMIIEQRATIAEMQWTLKHEYGIQFDGRMFFGG